MLHQNVKRYYQNKDLKLINFFLKKRAVYFMFIKNYLLTIKN